MPILLAAQLGAATVLGRVRLTNSTDSGVTKHHNFSNIVVWMEPLDLGMARLSKAHVQMLQRNKTFSPHVLVIAAGTSVDFPNADPIFHNAFSNFNGQIFDIGLYPPGSSRAVRFARPGIVRVFCNIHPSMSALIVVVASTFFAESEADGAYSISDVPAGSYRLHFFHERATAETLDELTQTVKVSNHPVELPAVDISETGYLPVVHKNKYGRDYAGHAGDSGTYSPEVR